MPEDKKEEQEQKQPDAGYNQFGFFVGENRNTWDCDELAAGNNQDNNTDNNDNNLH